MPRIRLNDLRAALEQRRPPTAASESDYKRQLVAEINSLPGGRARRIEDRFAVGVLDMIIKLPGYNVVMAEGKVINGFQFAPTAAQFEEGKRWEAAGVQCLLIGWKARQMYVSAWTDKADCRQCLFVPDVSYAKVLLECVCDETLHGL